ncbi:hypothetical protein [Alistipes shahii]|jgi:hypothetical protein|uniref:hypothetical protein n=1 Tax=Alistipes shahii TaxID=328814 RepID=UPI001C3776C6|nr:hypothetical protein [Alistipes shahii]MBV4293628.1 hypothetical protein [Alistipes shahii]
MKKLLCVTIALLCTATMQAQDEKAGVTKFLGIPVDGYKPAMIEKLKAKGFTPSIADKDVLEGEFNGVDVHVYIATNNNKVWRIMLADQNTCGETDIKIRFNRLCRQFENNPRYTSMTDEQIIPDDEDISYEITVNDKRYEAGFYQTPDSIAIYNESKKSLLSKYTQEQLDNPTEEISKVILIQYIANKINYRFNNKVWFMIAEYARKYYICMYYDNGYNKADGEDL